MDDAGLAASKQSSAKHIYESVASAHPAYYTRRDHSTHHPTYPHMHRVVPRPQGGAVLQYHRLPTPLVGFVAALSPVNLLSNQRHQRQHIGPHRRSPFPPSCLIRRSVTETEVCHAGRPMRCFCDLATGAERSRRRELCGGIEGEGMSSVSDDEMNMGGYTLLCDFVLFRFVSFYSVHQ